MSALLVAARAAHFASALALFGELAFALLVAGPAWRDAARTSPPGLQAFRYRLLSSASWTLVAGVASALVWFACETVAMSGKPLAQALDRDTLALVLTATMFGRLWILRMILAAALAMLLWAMGRSQRRGQILEIASFAVAAAFVASLAWAGHAASGSESQRAIQLGADALHLAAAGAWLGALLGLALFLRTARPDVSLAARVAGRFSALGIASVATLLFMGIINTRYLVGDFPGLVGTQYGHLLLAKLLLFVVMLVLAATNRMVVTPRLERQSESAVSLLRRNVLFEIAAGFGIVVIVGVLGVTIPGAHQTPVWPFAHTLEWPHKEESSAIRAVVSAFGVAAFVGVLATITGIRRRRRPLWIGGLACIAVAIVASSWLLAVPANPTTYAASPVPYAVGAITHGGALYAQHCATCHGASGRGDGPAAASLPTKPADLIEHTSHHRAGDLYWWIAHGIPGTRMPGFAQQLSDSDMWNVVAYLHALSDSEAARTMTGSVEPWRPIVAPDFTFESSATGQESVGQRAGTSFTLLVLFTVPQSTPRLDELAAQRSTYASAGVRVIALPFPASAQFDDKEHPPNRGSILAVAEPQAATIYAMFARGSADGSDVVESTHLEFLIDRQGYLRARWLGAPDQPARRTSEILAQVEILGREPPHPPASDRHRH